MLTPKQKACHQQFGEENLDMLRANPETFFSRIITRDETWVHHHDPENKRVLAMETQGVSYSQEMSCAAIRRKDHGNSFLGLRRFWFWNSCHTRRPLLRDTYSSTMVALRENNKQKCHGKLSTGVLLLHDNASAHKSCTSRAAIRKCGFVNLTVHPTVQTWLLVTTFSSETLKNFCVGDDFPMTMQSRKL